MDSHGQHDGTSKLEVELDNSDETVCDDGDMVLNTYSTVALSLERLDSEVSNLVKSGKVKAASAKDIACQRLVCEPVHCIAYERVIFQINRI